MMRRLLALALLLSGCAAVVPALPAGDPPGPERATLLVKTVSRGGLCMAGTTCESSITVLSDGTWTRLTNDTERTGTLPDEQVATLAGAVEGTRLATAPAFTGTCPTAWDGQEQVLTWLEDGRPVTVASCEREFDPADPLVIASAQLSDALD